MNNNTTNEQFELEDTITDDELYAPFVLSDPPPEDTSIFTLIDELANITPKRRSLIPSFKSFS